MSNNLSKKPKIEAIEFIRAICAIIIIAGHMMTYTNNEFFFRYLNYSNGGYTAVTVNIFLMISGGMLFYNNENVEKVSVFYFKRWKSIFPMFYITWFFFYISNAINTANFFYNGNPVSFVFTLLGIDGYLNYKFTTYYIIGEWFLGGLLLLYLLYPVFLKCINKFGWKILLLLIPIWIWQLGTDFFIIHKRTNLIYISGIFVLGILIFKYKLYQRTGLKFACVVFSAIFLFVPLPIPLEYSMIIGGICFFFALLLIGEIIFTIPILKTIISFIGNLSFPMFLVQNRIGYAIVSHFNPTTNISMIKCILFAIFLCIGAGWCIKAIASNITNTKYFKIIESVFLSPMNTN